ncbi:MAG: CvpA family protein [Bacteroidota bacterium]
MILDFICLLFAGYGFWVGYSKGIISTVLNLTSYMFGLLAAMKFGPVMGDLIGDIFPSLGKGSAMLFLAGVVVTFVLTLILFRLLARGLTGILQSVNVNFINQILGGVLSAFFFIFVFSGLVLFADRSHLIEEDAKAQSITYPILEPLPQFVWDRGQALWPVFQDFYDQAANAMDRLRDNVDQDESDTIFDVEEE